MVSAPRSGPRPTSRWRSRWRRAITRSTWRPRAASRSTTSHASVAPAPRARTDELPRRERDVEPRDRRAVHRAVVRVQQTVRREDRAVHDAASAETDVTFAAHVEEDVPRRQLAAYLDRAAAAQHEDAGDVEDHQVGGPK